VVNREAVAVLIDVVTDRRLRPGGCAATLGDVAVFIVRGKGTAARQDCGDAGKNECSFHGKAP
jgi:hypothetical protein